MFVDEFMLSFAAFGLGMLLSGIHFGGLWLTVRMLPTCERPRLFFWSSYFGRYFITLWSFAQIMKFGGLAMASSFMGFYFLRTFVLSRYCDVGMGEITGFKR